MKSLSLNGKDGSGKSQQIRLLQWNNENLFHVTKPLITYSSLWPSLQGYAMSQWWFEKVSIKELIDIIIESLNYRHADKVNGKLTIYDRGWRMFKAVCVATICTREKITLCEAIKIVDTQFNGKLDYEPDEYEILLEPDPNYFNGIMSVIKYIHQEDGIDFPKNAIDRYLYYQKNLQTAMESYFGPSTSRIKVCEPIINIQNKLRTLIVKQYGLKLELLCKKLELVVGFGGLSDCGKSSFADSLRRDCGFLRLKLRYFIELIEKHGNNRTPEKVVLGILQFLEYHPYIQKVSVESLHDPFIPAMLKLMLGNRCMITYIETNKKVRIARCSIESGVSLVKAVSIINEKDIIKRERGAEKVKTFSDIVFDNSTDTQIQNIRKFTELLNL